MSESPATSRGVLYPAGLPTFHRVPVTAALATFVRWFWIPEWRIEPGRSSRQQVIGFPACNLVVGDTRTEISGPATRASVRDLSGTGWAVGALLRPAAVAALVDNVSALRNVNREVDLPELSDPVRSAMSTAGPDDERRGAAVAHFTEWLLARLGEPDDDALLANHMVEAAESDPTLRSVPGLAAHLGVSTRSLQRLASRYVGVSPAFLIRRRRLQEAAARLRLDPELDLTALANESGYADHAHLTRDFRTHLGFTPSNYRSSLFAG